MAPSAHRDRACDPTTPADIGTHKIYSPCNYPIYSVVKHRPADFSLPAWAVEHNFCPKFNVNHFLVGVQLHAGSLPIVTSRTAHSRLREKLVELTGIEPVTSCLQSTRSPS